MDVLLHKLGISVKHLTIIHKTLRDHYPRYRAEDDKIVALGIEEFGRQLYAGGKIKGTLDRHMILADIFQYLFVGRGYFEAVNSPAKMAKFIELLLHVANLLILQEDLSVEPALRRALIENLEHEIEEDDLVEPGYPKLKPQLNALKEYGGVIVNTEGHEHENTFDSLLPKRVGLAVELIVYTMLLLKRYGYVVSLLLSQRLIRGGSIGAGTIDYIAPPDFLLLKGKGEIFGVEVGSAKDDQNTKFSIVTSIPVFSVRLGDHREPQPYRCGRCRHWMTYSDYVVRGLISGAIEPNVNSVGADEYLEGTMQGVTEEELIYFGVAEDHAGNERELRFHYTCVKDQETVIRRINGRSRHHTRGLILPVPYVKGLELLG
jgi:hypothetical protein